MYPQAHGQLRLFFTIFLALASLVSPGSGTCTDFTVSESQLVLKNSTQKIYLDHLFCAPEGDPCQFAPKTYNITVPRTLNISVADPAEEEALFDLAGRAMAHEAWGLPPQTDGFAFVTLSHEYTTLSADLDFDIDPGSNGTLYWDPSKFWVAGRLSGCSNATLEGVYIFAEATYMGQDLYNRTTLAGDLSFLSTNKSEDLGHKGGNTTLDDDENSASQSLVISVFILSICLTVSLATMTGLL